MFSFRKIINILVLISYVKMTIVSSFAMDSVVLPTLTTKLKIAPVFRDGGELDHVTLNVIEKDRATKTRRIAESKTVFTPECPEDLDNLPDLLMSWTYENGIVIGFKWDLKDLGIVKVDFNGSIIVDSAKQTDPARAVKISGANAIMLHNCSYYHLITKSEGVILTGGNTIHNLVATLANTQSGILIHPHAQKETLGNIMIKQGCLVNTADPDIMDSAVWDLGGGDFNNQGTLTLQGRHDILNANLVENKAGIAGGDLHVEAKDLINDGDIRTRAFDAKMSRNFVNLQNIETEDGIRLAVKGEGVNSGNLKSKKDITIEAEQGKFVNDGDIDATMIEGYNVINHGRIQSVKGMYLSGGENHGSVSDTQEHIFIEGLYTNYGTVSAPLLMGENFRTKGTVSIARIATITYEDFGGSLRGSSVTISPTCQKFITCRQSKINLDELIVERHESNTHRILDGVIQVKKLLMNSSLDISGIIDAGSIETKPRFYGASADTQQIYLNLRDTAKVRAEQTHLSKTKLSSSGIADLGIVELTESRISNMSTMTLVLARLKSAVPYAIHNAGTLQTRFDHPALAKNSSWVLGSVLESRETSTLKIMGDYMPVYLLYGKFHTDFWS
ncbi:MAG: hypothetical protein KF798_07765, partial [Candidatus Paracaedibacteraceae bacterium]|nr:hypothetical protein [Candidatus Paracaedibacteraceae bacterium]